jgi:hypothetical protein
MFFYCKNKGFKAGNAWLQAKSSFLVFKDQFFGFMFF